jgi:TolA-binding protein
MGATLDDGIFGRIIALSEQANEALESNAPGDAEAPLCEGLRLLPEPQRQWEAYTWLNGSLGETYFRTKRFREAKDVLFDAMNGPDGQVNPFILLRLGQVLLELGETAMAKEYLARAYMLEGDELLEAEDAKYITFLKKQ